MPTMEVTIFDATVLLPPGVSGWTWPVSKWEYVNITVIPISSNGNVQLYGLGATSDPESNRSEYFTLQNHTNDELWCFLTATVPHDSVT